MSDLNLLPLKGYELWQIRGANSVMALESLGYTVPERWFAHHPGAEFGFLARLGQRECLLLTKTSLNKTGALTGDALAAVEDTYTFARDDVLLVLEGKHWIQLMLQICSFDFSTAEPCQLVMTNAAGVSIWVRIPASEEAVLIGCDPGYSRYLMTTLEHVISDLKRNDTTIHKKIGAAL
jgi:hypothetical protein